MKNKKVWYAMLSVLFLTIFSGFTQVKAETYTGQAIWPSEKISNIYIKKVRDDGYIKYQQAAFIRRSEDNKFVYCVQPYTDIDNNLPYYNVERSDFAKVLNMTKDQWNRISLLAYYGYGYNENGYNHTAQKWYSVTQVMIWRTAYPTSDIYFTDTLNGTKTNKFDSEIAEMESILANHYKTPSFGTDELIVPIGQSKVLTDTNGVLSNFKVSLAENATATISGNTLTITSNDVGDAKVNLSKIASYYDTTPIVYYSNHSQNVFRVGNYDPIETSFAYIVVGGKIEINKQDSDTHTGIAQGSATLKGAIYGIYDESDTLITKITTDEKGYAISDYLPKLGNFYLKEITPSKGYTLDKNKYPVYIDKDNLISTNNVFEKVIESNITLFKVFASGTTGILNGESNITFDVYLKGSSEKYKSITTDKNGYSNITLPYGTWIFKQVNTTPDYEKVDDFEITVDEKSDSNIYKLVSNAPIEAKLKIVKVDKETKEQITVKGIKFKIKDKSTGEYVCQTITYPEAQKVCTFETDKNGVIITPSTLVGNFTLEEVEDQIVNGYIWNKESVDVHIGDGSEILIDPDYGSLVVVNFENQRVKGKVNITKYGEKLVLDSNSFGYEKVLLDNVKIGLYANEDIYIGKTLKYKKDELVKELYIVEGKTSIDDLELGKYYLKELETDDNHILDESKYLFELNYKDQYTEVVKKDIELENKYKKGTLEFTKTDLTSGKPIPNTLIEIYYDTDEESTLIYSGLTDENGKVIIKDLFLGKGHIIEKEAATGYQLTDEIVYFEIKENGEIVKASMTNEVVEVPNTISNDNRILDVISILLMTSGLGVIVYVSKKNKRK